VVPPHFTDVSAFLETLERLLWTIAYLGREPGPSDRFGWRWSLPLFIFPRQVQRDAS